MTDHEAGREERAEVAMARVEVKVDQLIKVVDELKIASVTRMEFKPIQMLTYGLVALLLTGIIGALLAQVISTK